MRVDSKTRKILNKRTERDNRAERAARHARDERLHKQREREAQQYN